MTKLIPLLMSSTAFGMTKGVQAKVKKSALLISDLIGGCQRIELPSYRTSFEWVSIAEAPPQMMPLAFRCRKEPVVGICFCRVVLFHPAHLRQDHRRNFLADRDLVPEHLSFLDISHHPIVVTLLAQAGIPFEVQDI